MYQRRNRGKPQFNRVSRVFVGAARFILAKVPPSHASHLPQTQQAIPFVPNDTGPDVPHRPGVGSLGNRVILAF